MKKVISKFLVLILLVFILTACNDKRAVNEIYNKAYNVEIDLAEFQDLIVAAIEKTAPAVVGVSNYQRDKLLTMRISGTGSGVVYDCEATMKDGSTVSNCETTINSNDVEKYTYLVVTNRHVISDADMIRVFLGDERSRVNANLIQFDDRVDIAVLSFDHHQYIQPIKFADSDQLKRGTFAIALGHPSGYEFYGSATFGIISYPKRYLSEDTGGDSISTWESEYIQHDVAINPGNSGGALINIKGELIGINTLKLLHDTIDNMGFAIPSNIVKDIVEILETGQKPSRKTLGIQVINVDAILYPEDYPGSLSGEYRIPEGIYHGLYITKVDYGRPAHNRLFISDIIIGINGIYIFYTHEFRAELNKVLTGDTIYVMVIRNNVEITITIKF